MTTTSTGPQVTGEEPAATRSMWSSGWNVAAAILLALVVVAGIVVAVFGGHQAGPAQPQLAVPPVAEPGVGGCGPFPAGDQLVPQSPPAATWALVGSTAAPTSATAGPLTQVGGVAACFAHTPTGALFAAVHYLAGTTDPQLIEGTIATRSAPGPGRDRLLALLHTDPTQVVGTGGHWQVAGYTFLGYTPASTTLSVLVAAAGGMAQVPLQLVWSSSDWQLVLPDDGNLTATTTAVPPPSPPATAPAGFTPWAGA